MRLFYKNESKVTDEVLDWESVTYRSALNGSGGWTLTAPYANLKGWPRFDRQVPASPTSMATGAPNGAGIAVLADDGVFEFAGVRNPSPFSQQTPFVGNPVNAGWGIVGTRTRASLGNAGKAAAANYDSTDGTGTVGGVDDLGFLRNRVYLPGALVMGEYPTITGNPGDEIPDLVESQIGAAADEFRRLPGWTFTTGTIAGGSDVTVQPAYGDLLTTANAFISPWDGPKIGMRCIQTWDGIEFVVGALNDAGITLSLENGIGQLVETVQSPKANVAYVVSYDTLGALQLDEFSTFDTSGGRMPLGYETVERVSNLTELANGEATTDQINGAGGGVLDPGGYSLKITPDSTTAKTLRVGTLVTAIIDGFKWTLPVTEVTVTANPDGEQSRLVTIGQPIRNPLIPDQTTRLYYGSNR